MRVLWLIRWFGIKVTVVQHIILISLNCNPIAVDARCMPEEIGKEFGSSGKFMFKEGASVV